jgi:hypothetical protein
MIPATRSSTFARSTGGTQRQDSNARSAASTAWFTCSAVALAKLPTHWDGSAGLTLWNVSLDSTRRPPITRGWVRPSWPRTVSRAHFMPFSFSEREKSRSAAFWNSESMTAPYAFR